MSEAPIELRFKAHVESGVDLDTPNVDFDTYQRIVGEQYFTVRWEMRTPGRRVLWGARRNDVQVGSPADLAVTHWTIPNCTLVERS